MEHVAGISTGHSETWGGAEADAVLTVLGADGAHPVACSIQSIAATRMQLRVAQPIAPDAPLRVESHDSLWLGTAEECRGVPDDYILTLHLSHCLRNLPELSRLAERFRGRSTRHQPVTGAIDWNA